ncbi:MAG: tetrahydromethanopterin S-methyltransferase subunit A [Deltaproteobacteria bacterium]|nr:tetrahydromethanopterin S-methyltransferase subunit A [Deltaproteobacteria bacterium]
MLKVKPHPDYPPEDGRYLRGNDFSPVAVAIILNCDEDKIQPELVNLVKAGIEGGAALSGSVQTPNIGFEKMVCNITANPNIRYVILGGPESQGHLTGDALKALLDDGVDERKRIVGTEASNAVLYNLSIEMIERFRKQVSLIDLQFEGDPEQIRKAVWSCYQENPVEFRGYKLYDPGAYPEPPLCGKLTWRVTQPWAGTETVDEREKEARDRAIALMERLKTNAMGKRPV